MDMNKIIQTLRKSWVIMLALVFVVLMITPQAQAGGQGDKFWSESDITEVKATTSGVSAVGVAFPRDPNVQAIVKYVDVTAANAADNLHVYQGKTSAYREKLTVAWNPTTTRTLTGADMSFFTVADYIVVDDGAGNVFWSQVSTGGYASGTTIEHDLTLYGGVTNFTFPVGSYVYEMENIADLTIGNASVTKSADSALLVIARGRPSLYLIDATTTGVKINAITVKYE